MKKRNGEIDVMRFAVCMMIVLYHFCQKYGSDKFGFCKQGNIGVEFFFVVSGYLLAVTASKLGTAKGRELADDTWHFIVKKVKPFYRYYIFGIFLQLIVVLVGYNHLGFRDVIRGFLQGIPQFTLITMGLDYKYRSILFLDGSWYLSVMVLASFVLYPLLRRYGDYAKKIILPIAALFLIGYLYTTTGQLNNREKWNGVFYLGFLRGLSEMALGASLHPLGETLSERLDWLISSDNFFIKFCLTLFKYSCYLVFFLYAKGLNLGKNYSLHALLFVSVGILLSFMNVGYTIRESRFTRWLGKVSLPIYMYHQTFRNTLPDFFPLEAGQNGRLFLLIGVTIAICIVLYKLTDLLAAWLNKGAAAIRNRLTERKTNRDTEGKERMKKRNGEIDVMRFLAAVMIVVYHYCDAYGSKNFNICRQGSIAVEFFFVVTGYLMAQSASKRGRAEGTELADDTWHFVLNKIRSFYRYYIMAIFMQTVILYILVRHTGCKDIIRGVLKGIPEFTLTSLAFGLHNKGILYLSGGGWYLSVMVIGSLFLYSILRRYGDVAKKIIFPLLSMFLIGYIFNENGRLNFWDQWNGYFYLGLLRGIGEMSLGASLHALSEGLSGKYDWLINSEKVFPKTLLTIFKLGCYVVFFAFAKGFNLGSNFALSALLFVSLGVMLSFMNVGYTLKDSGFTRTLGKLSLGIFVFHGMFKSAAPKLIDVKPGQNGRLLLLAGGTIVICIVLYYLTDLLAAGLKKAMASVRRKIEA